MKKKKNVKKEFHPSFVVIVIFLLFIGFLYVLNDNDISITGMVILNSGDLDGNNLFFMLLLISIYAIVVSIYLSYRHNKAKMVKESKKQKKKRK